MNVYFDTEFTGLVPGTTLISIGMVAETGEHFYAEFTDYDESLCDDWVKEHVINYLWMPKNHPACIVDDKDLRKPGDEMLKYVHGNSDHIASELEQWLVEIPYGRNDDVAFEQIQLVSDVCHYDMTLLCNLFGGAMNLPARVNPVCYDLCQDIGFYFGECTEADGYYSVSDTDMKHAFDISRESLVCSLEHNEPLMEFKHNALCDARVIKRIYEGLRKRK